jgi:hypothetical protein
MRRTPLFQRVQWALIIIDFFGGFSKFFCEYFFGCRIILNGMFSKGNDGSLSKGIEQTAGMARTPSHSFFSHSLRERS